MSNFQMHTGDLWAFLVDIRMISHEHKGKLLATWLFVQQLVWAKKKNKSKFHITHPLCRESPVTSGFPSRTACNVERVSMLWGHSPSGECHWTLLTKHQHSFNSFWPSDEMWQLRSGTTLALVMGYCLAAPKPLPKPMLTYQRYSVAFTWK